MNTALRQARAEVVSITNGQRRGVGLPALRASRGLNRSAQAAAKREAAGQVLRHYPRWWALIERFVGKLAKEGENIGDGQDSAAAVCQQWKNSPEHWANISDPKFKTLGVGMVRDGRDVHWWVQHFGG